MSSCVGRAGEIGVPQSRTSALTVLDSLLSSMFWRMRASIGIWSVM